MSCELSETATPEDFARPRWVGQPDVLERAQRLSQKFEEAYGRAPVGVWAAPGRANLMGEYVDFSGGMCLPFAHQYVTLTAAAPREDGVLNAQSMQDADESVADDRPRSTRIDDIEPGVISGWFGYVAGVAWGMNRVARGASAHPVAVPELGLPTSFGADLMVDSTVPIGAGLASSAALECSVALSLFSLNTGNDHPNDALRRALARACMDAENYIVGANTGGLDQTASLRSHAGRSWRWTAAISTSSAYPPIPRSPASRGWPSIPAPRTSSRMVSTVPAGPSARPRQRSWMCPRCAMRFLSIPPPTTPLPSSIASITFLRWARSSPRTVRTLG